MKYSTIYREKNFTLIHLYRATMFIMKLSLYISRWDPRFRCGRGSSMDPQDPRAVNFDASGIAYYSNIMIIAEYMNANWRHNISCSLLKICMKNINELWLHVYIGSTKYVCITYLVSVVETKLRKEWFWRFSTAPRYLETAKNVITGSIQHCKGFRTSWKACITNTRIPLYQHTSILPWGASLSREICTFAYTARTPGSRTKPGNIFVPPPPPSDHASSLFFISLLRRWFREAEWHVTDLTFFRSRVIHEIYPARLFSRYWGSNWSTSQA
jgi:hypothetical protein